MTDRYMIVGLGNPGPEYQNTRHNVGFMCMDALIAAHHLSVERHKLSKAKIAVGTIAHCPVVVVKPQTFMNLSGGSVQGLAAFYKIPPQRILVVFDDLDIPPGTVRIRAKGGSGGHRGMRDIIQRLGTQDFPRIRFGIGRPPDRMDPADYVLQPFSRQEQPLIAETIDRVLRAIELWLAEGIEAAMNRFNGTADEVRAREIAAQAPPAPLNPQAPPSAEPPQPDQ